MKRVSELLVAAAKPRWVRRGAAIVAVLVVSLTGVILGVLLGANTSADVGPFRAELTISPAWSGETEIAIPPLGSLHLNSHDGPMHLKVQFGTLDQGRTAALIDDPDGIGAAGRTAVDDATAAVMRLGLRALGASVLGALLLSALVFRTMRRVAWSGFSALLIAGGCLGLAAATARPDSIGEPRYEGLLVNAPAVVGDARRIADNYGRYADQLQALVGNVSRVYAAVSTLPVYEPDGRTTRVLHVSDLHLSPTAWQVVQTVVDQFDIDVVIDTGDITDWGSTAETSYVASIGALNTPYVYIRGNHDSALTAAAVDAQPNTTVLDRTSVTVAGLTIAGIGDPRFTPNKTTEPAPGAAAPVQAAEGPEVRSGQELATVIAASPVPVDIALVHDPASAGPLAGTAPIVLAGHTHGRAVSLMAPGAGGRQTRLMVQGSTGGAGLRGLQGEQPMPLAMSVLYFDDRQKLQAYDDIAVGGTGQTQVNLVRKVIDDPPAAAPSAVPSAEGAPPRPGG
jgi:predicted MPP superfamily phosphohydrolase